MRTFHNSASAPPSRLKAIQLPSGDHDGWKPWSLWGTKLMVPAAGSRIQMPAVGPERGSGDGGEDAGEQGEQREPLGHGSTSCATVVAP